MSGPAGAASRGAVSSCHGAFRGGVRSAAKNPRWFHGKRCNSIISQAAAEPGCRIPVHPLLIPKAVGLMWLRPVQELRPQ